jgi:hypothetical protein
MSIRNQQEVFMTRGRETVAILKKILKTQFKMRVGTNGLNTGFCLV